MDTQEEMETVEDNMLDTDWRENISIGAQDAKNRQEMLDTLAEFQEVRDRCLGHIDMAKSRLN